MSRPKGTIGTLLLTIALAGCSGAARYSATQPGVPVAEAALAGGSPRVALQVAQTILARAPDDAAALVVRGDALTQLGQTADAAPVFEHALRIDPASTRARLGLGRLRLGTDPTAAAGLFQDILTTEPGHVAALSNLGVALDLLGRHAEAQTAYQTLLRDRPDNAAARVNLALSLSMSGAHKTALNLIEPMANAPGAPPKLRHNRAAILAMAGREAEAEAVLKPDLSPTEVRQTVTALRQPPPPPDATLMAMQERLPAVFGPGAETTVTTVTQTAAALPARLPPADPHVVTVLMPPMAPAASALAATTVPDIVRTPPPAPRLSPVKPRHRTSIQLGAFASEDAARAEWRRLRQVAPELVSSRHSAITKVTRDGTVYWRLRTSGFNDRGAGETFCSRLRPTTERCWVIGI